MKYRNYAKVLLLAGLAQMSAAAFAHTKLESAKPVDGDVLRAPPEVIELGFSEEVQLLKLEIATEAGVKQEIQFAPRADAAKTFSIPVPAMTPEAYVVSWTVLGADGHRVEGDFGFLIDALAHEPADAESAKDGD